MPILQLDLYGLVRQGSLHDLVRQGFICWVNTESASSHSQDNGIPPAADISIYNRQKQLIPSQARFFMPRDGEKERGRERGWGGGMNSLRNNGNKHHFLHHCNVTCECHENIYNQ